MNSFQHHVVLVSPEVHWNTGNIGRTCLGTGALLHLIKPLGFSLEDRQVKRAGLDYWHKVPLKIWNNLEQFLNTLQPDRTEVALLTKSGERSYWEMPYAKRLFMIFGSETRGLPDALYRRYPDQAYRIPIQPDIRCLNLSTAVGIVLYEAVRRWEMNLSL